MSELRLAQKTISVLVKDQLHYPNRLVLDTFIMIARYGVLIILYWYVFRLRGGSIDNTTFAPVAWSMFMYFALMTLRLRDVSRLIMEDVRSGKIETLFSKPISYLNYRIWWQVGTGAYSFLVMTGLGAIVLALAVGIPSTMTAAAFIPTLLITFIGCCLLSLAIYLTVGLLAFWIEDINPVFWIIDKAVMILGGSYLPIAFFPPLMYKIAVYSPFGASQFVTHTVLESWRVDWPSMIGIQLAWIIVLGAAVWVIFTQARKKISVNGG
jgi:ABC-2 type transport system permease protein